MASTEVGYQKIIIINSCTIRLMKRIMDKLPEDGEDSGHLAYGPDLVPDHLFPLLSLT